MPRELTANAETGFLESTNSLVTFSSERKLQLLQFAKEFLEKNGRYPDITTLCNAVGICDNTFTRHLKFDTKFREAFKEIELKGRRILENVMFDRGITPGGYMDRITWLRHHFPDEYNPERNVNVTVDKKSTLDRFYGDVQDAEIVE